MPDFPNPNSAATASDDEPFEQSLARLEKIVAEMEEGELPLDQLVTQYEQGVRLVQKCTATLKAAEERVKVIHMDENGSMLTEELSEQAATTEEDAEST